MSKLNITKVVYDAKDRRWTVHTDERWYLVRFDVKYVPHGCNNQMRLIDMTKDIGRQLLAAIYATPEWAHSHR